MKLDGDSLLTNTSTGTIAGATGGVEVKYGGTIVNAGKIRAAQGVAVSLYEGGTLSNASTGVISVTDGDGILVSEQLGTINNSGTILGAATGNLYGGSGIELFAGGTVTNGQTGSTAGHRRRRGDNVRNPADRSAADQ